jgi:hypothetical protein
MYTHPQSVIELAEYRPHPKNRDGDIMLHQENVLKSAAWYRAEG